MAKNKYFLFKNGELTEAKKVAIKDIAKEDGNNYLTRTTIFNIFMRTKLEIYSID